MRTFSFLTGKQEGEPSLREMVWRIRHRLCPLCAGEWREDIEIGDPDNFLDAECFRCGAVFVRNREDGRYCGLILSGALTK
jgi:hypothetical protein